MSKCNMIGFAHSDNATEKYNQNSQLYEGFYPLLADHFGFMIFTFIVWFSLTALLIHVCRSSSWLFYRQISIIIKKSVI